KGRLALFSDLADRSLATRTGPVRAIG
ncbi:MAG: damage-inducible protein, partial [Mesorhizobium sp.]